jgi:hypothetical protein
MADRQGAPIRCQHQARYEDKPPSVHSNHTMPSQDHPYSIDRDSGSGLFDSLLEPLGYDLYSYKAIPSLQPSVLG